MLCWYHPLFHRKLLGDSARVVIITLTVKIILHLPYELRVMSQVAVQSSFAVKNQHRLIVISLSIKINASNLGGIPKVNLLFVNRLIDSSTEHSYLGLIIFNSHIISHILNFCRCLWLMFLLFGNSWARGFEFSSAIWWNRLFQLVLIGLIGSDVWNGILLDNLLKLTVINSRWIIRVSCYPSFVFNDHVILGRLSLPIHRRNTSLALLVVELIVLFGSNLSFPNLSVHSLRIHSIKIVFLVFLLFLLPLFDRSDISSLLYYRWLLFNIFNILLRPVNSRDIVFDLLRHSVFVNMLLNHLSLHLVSLILQIRYLCSWWVLCL